jgi:hypothetical protein
MAIYFDNIKMVDKKTCKTCNLEKKLDEFSKRKISKDGYRCQCNSCLKKIRQEYYEKNKEIIKIKHKKWSLNNQEKLKNNIKNFHLKNPEYRKNYHINNKPKINERNKKRRNFDDNYKLKENIRHLISNSLKNNGFRKNTKTIEILGCNNEFFRSYIESQWSLPNNLDKNGNIWMNWGNYGNPKDGIYQLNKSWDLDHIIPLVTAKTEEDIIKLNHYSNFQPLCSYINRINKRGKVNYK